MILALCFIILQATSPRSAIDRIPALWLTVLGTLLGVLLTIVYEHVRDRYRFKRELRDNNFIDISGKDWHVAWQTCVDKQVLLNTEHIEIKQKGKVVRIHNVDKSKENPKGAYLWEARMQFYQGKYLLGWYFPVRRENLSSKGTMFCSYFSTQKTFYGKWVGTAYDGDFANGFFVISKNRDNSLKELTRIVSLHSDPVNVISHTL